MARRLFPAWPSHSLENVAIGLNIANKAEHRALSDARLVKDVFLELLLHIPTVNSIADLVRVSPLLTFADAPVCAIEPPEGFEALTTAITERCAITIVYEQGWQRPRPQTMTPRWCWRSTVWRMWSALCHPNGCERKSFGWIASGSVGLKRRGGGHGYDR